MVEQRVVVVTGCSKNGIGAATAEEFLRNGFKVFAAGRNLSKMESLSHEIIRIELDVNDDDSVKRGVEEILLQSNGRIGKSIFHCSFNSFQSLTASRPSRYTSK